MGVFMSQWQTDALCRSYISTSTGRLVSCLVAVETVCYHGDIVAVAVQ
jgi:hypothetical protein